jgi:ribonuclease G
MTKELIISANVHEKKVAILEDGVVTEFYVERSDENQGVVGNLYKGRVMKVLPGMQSAFVDIGLERDAFLYVSDFTELMEDEELIEFKESEAQAESRKVAEAARRGEHQEAAKLASEHAQAVQASRATERAVPIEDAVEQLAEIVDESIIPAPSSEEELEEYPLELIEEARVESEAALEQACAPTIEEPAEEAAASRTRRNRGKAAAARSAQSARRSGKKKAEKEEDRTTKRRRHSAAAAGEAPEPPATQEAPATESAQPELVYERVTDEGAPPESTEPLPGDLLKDAIVEEKIFDEVHEAECSTAPAEPEPEQEWRVGSFRSHLTGESGLERVLDEESTPEEDAEAVREKAEAEAAPMRHIGDVIRDALCEYIEASDRTHSSHASHEATEAELASAPSEEANQPEGAQASVREPSRRGRFAVRRGGRGRRRRREAAQPAEEEKARAEAAALEADEAAEETVRRVTTALATRSSRKTERAPAAITELLREGQEILVQIAKEPIAKKGARITSHIALPGRYLVYMPTVNHIGVSRKIASELERVRLKRIVLALREREGAQGGFIVRTACEGHSEQELLDDMRYLLRTWADIRKKAEASKAPALIHRDLDLVQRIIRDRLSDEFSAIRIDNEAEYIKLVEFVNRINPKLVSRVKLYTGDQPILEKYGVQAEIDKAVKPRVWLKSGGYIVINQTEALVAIDVNTGKFVGKSDRLEDTITRTNLEAAKEIVRQIRLRDLGGIIVIDFIDMEERKNRQKVMAALQQELEADRAPSKILSINDFGLVAITRKRVKQSLERTLCTPCPYCQGAGLVKSPQTICFEILEQAKAMSKHIPSGSDVTLRVSPDVAEAFRTKEKAVFEEIEAYFNTTVTLEADPTLHREHFDFAIV